MIVVTGAAGFIGSNIIADILRTGQDPVAAIDWIDSTDKWRNLTAKHIAAYVEPEATFDFLERNLSEIRIIVHMGAVTSTMERDIRKLVALNVRYTIRLWDWCAKHDVPFIYASSAATYGARESDFIDDESPSFLAALEPSSLYGWSKALTDKILARRVATGGKKPPQWVGLKFFNVYGPNEYHKGPMQSIVLKLFEAAKSSPVMRLFKSHRTEIPHGQQKRDFVYVRDCTRAVLWFMSHSHVSGIFNIGTGRARSFTDVASALAEAMGVSPVVEFIDMPEEIRTQYQYFTQADVRKLERVGLSAQFCSLEQGINDYVHNFLSRRARYL